MKKYISIFIIMIIPLLGCRGKERMGFTNRDKLNLQMAEKIVNCINARDVEGLYVLFSEDVRNNDLTLNEDIRKIYQYLNGQIETYEKWAVGSTTDIEQGQNATYYYSSFKIMINRMEYYLYYIYYPKNDFRSTAIGLKSLKIVKVEEDDKYFCYWTDMEPGVFLPDDAE